MALKPPTQPATDAAYSFLGGICSCNWTFGWDESGGGDEGGLMASSIAIALSEYCIARSTNKSANLESPFSRALRAGAKVGLPVSARSRVHSFGTHAPARGTYSNMSFDIRLAGA